MSAAEQLDLAAYERDMRDRAADHGIRAAQIGDVAGYELACREIKSLAATKSPFTSNDISNIGSNAIGAAFRQMARLGVIVAVGFTTAKSPASHAHLVREWVGAS
jgi:hypothetical protein